MTHGARALFVKSFLMARTVSCGAGHPYGAFATWFTMSNTRVRTAQSTARVSCWSPAAIPTHIIGPHNTGMVAAFFRQSLPQPRVPQ
jgi:hypothetical protein